MAAQGFPLPTELGGTSVTIGGVPVPLFVVTSGQINAMLPFDLAVNTSVPIVVTRHNAVSAPQPVSLASSQPGVFTQSANGQGIGIIVKVNADGSQVVAGNGNSAKFGDAVVIYCTGLGDVTPSAVAGFPAPPSPLFAYHRPGDGDPWRHQRSGVLRRCDPGIHGALSSERPVPSGIAPSKQAPLVLSQGGRISATVTIPIE